MPNRSNHRNTVQRTQCLVAALTYCCFSQPAQAIVPINVLITPPEGISGEAGLSINGQSGNKDEQEYSANGLLRYKKSTDLYVLIGDYSYSETNDMRDEDELFLHGRWVRQDQFGKSIDSELFVQYQYDDFADISGRSLIGANVRWRNEVKNSNAERQVIVGTGLFYESETSEQTSVTEDTIRANVYTNLVYRHTGDFPYVVSASTYIQPAVDDLSDLRMLGVGSINFPIRPSLSIGFDIEVKHNSTPFSDVKKTDIDYGVTLVYTF